VAYLGFGKEEGADGERAEREPITGVWAIIGVSHLDELISYLL